MSSMSFGILRQGSNYKERPQKARLKRKVKENHNLFFQFVQRPGKYFPSIHIQAIKKKKKSRPKEAKAALDQIIKQAFRHL